jgi:hypothetical protein
MTQHLEVARDEIEHLGSVFTELAHRRAAVRAGAACGRVHDRLTWQVGGKAAGYTPQLGAALHRWRRGRFFNRDGFWHGDFIGRGPLQIGQRQLQLQQRCIRLLGGTTETPTLQARNLSHEFGDHLVAADEQTLQRFDVIGQGRSDRHQLSVERVADNARTLRRPLRLPAELWPPPIDPFH